MFSPHPDDESIIGALPLRLRRELNYDVRVVAVTQGSRADRQTARFEEMRGACDYLSFKLIQTRPGGLLNINPKTRNGNPAEWAAAVEIIARIITEHRPSVIFMPHDQDWNSTHIGTHFLVTDALKTLGPDFQCRVVETEFWRAMAEPNLVIESTPDEVADLVAAISFHKGEVIRNPYHLTLPAWMADNVRRGGEIVGGQGGAAPTFPFATLYRIREWSQGGFETTARAGRVVARDGALADLFGKA
ncbi:MAG TPA: PIG-L family deacetylase [Geothrix sp.]|nr:PIG-L family deacetylase [Geothrix sp.]